MTQRFQYQVRLTLLIGVVVAVTACESGKVSHPSNSAVTASAIASPQAASPADNPAKDKSSEQDNSYEKAIARATAANSITRLAQSRDDWRLVADRWQQAIQLMGTVPKTSPRQVQAQKKLTEYRRNLAYAQQQTRRSSELPFGEITVRLPQSYPTSASRSALPIAPTANAPSTLSQTVSLPATPATSVSRLDAGQPRIFSVPIVRRAGSTPVVSVTFNGSQSFEMIVDTGASGTLITRAMANALRVVPVGQANVDTASQRNVTVPLGYVNSMSVGGAMAQNVLVAVAGPELSIGLLGHDFFGGYDVTIREHEVEFSER
jgi:predicted aspartyl protease